MDRVDILTEKFEGRKIAIEALTGSHNYNLNTPESDEDYKYFVFPTFDDLYHNRMFSLSEQTDTFDFSCHDIRRLGELLWKANLNFVEVLFSRKSNYLHAFLGMYAMAEALAAMNLPDFGRATYGMSKQKMGEIFKGTAKTKHLIEKYGYDTKEALHAIRCLFVLQRLSLEGMSFSEAIWFEDNSHERNFLLDIKNGEISLSHIYSFVENWNALKKDKVTSWFDSHEPNYELKNELDNFIKYSVKQRINVT